MTSVAAPVYRIMWAWLFLNFTPFIDMQRRPRLLSLQSLRPVMLTVQQYTSLCWSMLQARLYLLILLHAVLARIVLPFTALYCRI